MNMQTIFELNNILKSYPNKKVFEKFNLKIDILHDLQNQERKSNIIALLGSNGAGKTTLLNVLLGLENIQSGTVKVFEKNPVHYKTRSFFGTTLQEIHFPEGIQVCEILNFVQNHYKNPLKTKKLIEVFQLSEFLNCKATGLSGGQKRRLALALAFIGNPPLIFLDEPTTGLDVVARKSFWEYIKHETNKTILLTTHDLSEIEKVADRLLFLQNGKIIFDGSVSEFKKQYAFSSRKITFYGENIDLEKIKAIEYVKTVRSDENHVTIESYQSDDCIRELVKNNVPFQNISIEASSLEDSFINLSKG